MIDSLRHYYKELKRLVYRKLFAKSLKRQQEAYDRYLDRWEAGFVKLYREKYENHEHR